MTNTIQDTLAQLKAGRIVAIIRGNFSASQIIEIGDALLASPVLAMAITLNSPNALDYIQMLVDRAGPNMRVGAGMVRTPAQARAVLKAGAQFWIAPAFSQSVARLAHSNDVLYLPGVFTPTEAETARAAGCQMVKLFPADPAHLQTLRGPLADIDVMPAGGITSHNLAQYAQAGAAAVGVGRALVSGPQATMAEIISSARAMQAVWDNAIK